MCVEHFCGTKTRNSALLRENAGNTVGVVVVVVVGGVGVDVVVDVVLLLLWVLMLVWLPLVFLRSGFFPQLCVEHICGKKPELATPA